ncbi:hypothetical protein HI914_04422 [Erysiphe necator]|nr:hypothetical protein HI914_04422 [Erysiphe necator]
MALSFCYSVITQFISDWPRGMLETLSNCYSRLTLLYTRNYRHFLITMGYERYENRFLQAVGTEIMAPICAINGRFLK